MKPRFCDDGCRPELDLHGCAVDEALSLVRELIYESIRYGRNSIKIIHGKSTTVPRKRTIKSALTELVDSDEFSTYVIDSYKSEGHMTIALRRAGSHHPSGRMSLNLNNFP
ncbi:MAG: Smr/MutS family protein [Bacteroidetes bacterium]|nr:Smr/MutS family protein [Bacteroidota bacterium]MCY4224747.1 Smr/MutS family protein [Bacteroidota bacterium]